MSDPHLAGKALLALAGAPLLERLVQRLLSAESDFQLVVSTTARAEDEPILELCRRIDVRCVPGNQADRLDRQFQLMCNLGADLVATASTDSPLIDPSVIDRVLALARNGPAIFDYVSNLRPPTYPAGNDFEVMSADALESAWKESHSPEERNHVASFVWKRPDRFRVGNVTWETGLDYSESHRWVTVYPEDYQFARAVYDELWSVRRPVFRLNDIIKLTSSRPDLPALNAHLLGQPSA